METPPQSELSAARNRMYQGAANFRRGTMTLGGQSYDCAVAIKAETFGLTDRGTQKVQRVEVVISKGALPNPPAQGDPLKTEGLAFKVLEIEGHNPTDESWYLLGQRTPGGDS